MNLSRLLTLGGVAVTAGIMALVSSACTETNTVTQTDTVQVPVGRFNPPKDTLNGFLGYFTVASKQTQCGQCHAGQQATWVTTKHAVAWSSLQSSGHAASYCYGCHSVSQLGNALDDSIPGGYTKVADSTYYDVQCESCHGPGAAPANSHAAAPGVSNRPLARIKVPSDTIAAVTSGTCAACHQGTHEPYTQEWSQSAHAGVVEDVINSYVSNPAGEASCMPCHEGRNTLKAWGVNTNYVEANDAINLNTAMPTTCAICHDPHNNANPGQVRFAVDNPDPSQNLCMKCHLRRVEPAATSSRGPHAPQGGVLLGYAGWWPAIRDTVTATHGNVLVNTRLCAGCHVNRVTVTDTAGAFQLQSVGHLFSPDPCLDAKGNPTAASCARPGDAGYVSGSRFFTGCQAAGCHNSATQAENAMASQRAVIGALADALWKDANGNQVLFTTNAGASAFCKSNSFAAYDAGDTGLLTELTTAQADTAFCTTDGVVSVAEGVLFNVRMVGENRYANADGSFGVHNPLLAQQLLAVSVTAMQNRYGVFAPPAIQQIVAQVNQKVAAFKASRGQLSSK